MLQYLRIYCILTAYVFFFFFFQAEDGIRDYKVTGVQTCALPISLRIPSDTLIMATDGIRSGFATRLATESSPQEIAESILARFAKGTDDAHIDRKSVV